jgi:hypothetical protein
VTPGLQHIRRLAAVTSYGRARWVAWLMGDPPRKMVMRQFRYLIHRGAKVRYLAHYAIDASTDASRRVFLDKVERAMARL